MLKILSWNIQAGGGSRIRKIVKAIIESKSDIVTLSEFRNNETGTKLRALMLTAGYRHQVVSHPQPNENSVIIFSKVPFDSEFYPNSDPNYSNNIITAHFSAFSLMGVYLPHKKKHGLLSFINELVNSSSRHFIIAGDFNTGKNYIDQKGNSFWYTEDLLALEKKLYVDAFRLVHQDVSEFSWYSHHGNGFRYDHTYIHESLKPIVKDCYYIHQWREEKLSDHSPMFLEF